MTLREVVRTAADGTGLDLRLVPTPIPVQRVAVRLMDALTPAPLSTPAQLQMLIDGLYGDDKPARRDLGLVPRSFTSDSVRALEGAIGPLLGFSMRLVDNRTRAEWLARRRGAFTAAIFLAGFALALQVVLAFMVPNVWYRMAVAAVVLSAVALTQVDVGWRELYRPALRHLGVGVAAAVVLYALGAAVARHARAEPPLASQMAALYGGSTRSPMAWPFPCCC